MKRRSKQQTPKNTRDPDPLEVIRRLHGGTRAHEQAMELVEKARVYGTGKALLRRRQG